MDFAFTFLKTFFLMIYLALPLLGGLAGLVVLLGLAVGRLERWPRHESVYWAFITATTVGYGDIRPLRGPARLMAVFIAFTGVIFTGILVSLAVQASSIAFSKHIEHGLPDHAEEVVRELRETIGRE